MKKKWINIILILVVASSVAEGQLLDKIGKKVERKVNQRIDRKTDKAIDKTLDKAEDVIEGSSTRSKPSTRPEKNGSTSVGAVDSPMADDFSYDSKFDFVPGDKILFYDDFEQEAIGDFPSRWSTNGAGEVVSLRSEQGKWLRIPDNSISFPELGSLLPQHFTIEFDLYYPEIGKRPPITFGFTEVASPDRTPLLHKNIFYFLIPPSVKQAIGYSTTMYSGRETLLEWPVDKRVNIKNHVSIAINGTRVRLYIQGRKIVDLPKGFDKATYRNNFHFRSAQLLPKATDAFYISNLRIAETDKDARSLLAEGGKYSTTGIYFNTGTAVIKPQSQAVLKELAALLNENSELRLLIVGHTDNVGNTATNLRLSEQRAIAVKTALCTHFGIEDQRLSIIGKGQSDPVADNQTVEGRAQNRRVEFLRQ